MHILVVLQFVILICVNGLASQHAHLSPKTSKEILNRKLFMLTLSTFSTVGAVLEHKTTFSEKDSFLNE